MVLIKSLGSYVYVNYGVTGRWEKEEKRRGTKGSEKILPHK